MALAKDSTRQRVVTYIDKENKSKLEEISKKCNLPMAKVIDMAIEQLYDKIKTEGITIKMD